MTAASAGTVGLKARREVLSVSLARLAATAEMTTIKALQVEGGVTIDVVGQLRLASSLRRLSLIKHAAAATTTMRDE